MEAKIIPLPDSIPDFWILNSQTDNSLPLFTVSVRAGFPSPAADYSSEPIDLNRLFTENPAATFLVRVEGDSMVGAHIEPGDLAVIDRSVKAVSGRIVLAFVEGEFTIKRLLLEKDGAYLVPENPKYSVMKFDNPDNCRIWGVVVGIVKRL